MIEIRNLVKTYGKVTALDDVSFDVGKGEILGFLGPNGAGKSTAMNIITGYLAPTSGSVIVDGIDVADKPLEVRKMIGYLPEQPPLYGDMTVNEYLNFICDLKSVSQKKRKNMLDDITYIVKIGDVRKRLVRNLSKGYRQRVGFAQALVGDPPILILDEPTVGLDPKQIIEIRKLIRSLGKKHTVIFSSHVLSEISATCDRIIVISEGRLVADSKADELSKALADTQKLSLTVEGSPSDVLGEIKKIPGVKKYMKVRELGEKSAVYSVEYGNEFDIRREVFSAMARINAPILEMKSGNESLEDMFLKLTQGAGKAGR